MSPINYQAFEVFTFCQDDLEANSVFMLDCISHLYLVGSLLTTLITRSGLDQQLPKIQSYLRCEQQLNTSKMHPMEEVRRLPSP